MSLLAVAGCAKAVVVRTTTSTNGLWKAQVVAVNKPPLGTVDAELWLTSRGKRVSRKVLFGGRDALQDVELEVTGLNIVGSNVVVTTRGTFGSPRVEYPLGQ